MGRKTAGFVSFLILITLAYLAFGQAPAPPTGVTIGTAPTRYTLTVSKAGDGLGTVTGMGITCGTDCSQSLNPLTAVDLIATNSTGSVFTGWAGDCATVEANVCSLNMDAAKNVTAQFDISEFVATVTKSGTGLGTITSNPAGINCDPICTANFDFATSVILTATPSPPSVFTAWTGDCVSAATTCSLSMTTDRTVNAQFTLPPSNFVLTVTKSGTGVGTVTSAPAGINCGATCSASFVDPTVVTLTAVAGGGSTFAGWSGEGCTGTGSCIVTMSQARAVAAVFTLSGTGNTFIAASCSETDVGAKIALASSGDTVIIPDGSCAWTTGVAISQGITLKGQNLCTGATQNNPFTNVNVPSFTSCPTKITNNVLHDDMIRITESTSGSVKVQNIWFELGTGASNTGCGTPPTYGSACGHVKVNNTAGGLPSVVSYNLFTNLSSHTVVRHLGRRGVIARNTVMGKVSGTCLNNGGIIRNTVPDSVSPWHSPPLYGNADDGTGVIYIEDNYISDMYQNDLDTNSRSVWRGNILWNAHIGAHGQDSGGAQSGMRHRETYYNVHDWRVPDDNGAAGCTTAGNFQSYVQFRGGTGLVHNSSMRSFSGSGFAASSHGIAILSWQRGYNGGDTAVRCWGHGDTAGESYPGPRQSTWGFSTGATIPRQTITSTGAPGPALPQYFQDSEPLRIWRVTGAATDINIPFLDGGIGTPTCAAAGITGIQSMATYFQGGRDYISPATTPSATDGPIASRPLTCTGATFTTGGNGQAHVPLNGAQLYWATDEGEWHASHAGFDGRAYLCTDPGNANPALRWSLFYTPYIYPHPLNIAP